MKQVRQFSSSMKAVGIFAYGGGVDLMNKINELLSQGHIVYIRATHLEYF